MSDDVAFAADVARDMFWMALKVGAPIVGAVLIAGILAALFQSLTQIQEASVALVPKLAAVIAAALVVLPWAMVMLVDYTRGVFGEMGHWFP